MSHEKGAYTAQKFDRMFDTFLGLLIAALVACGNPTEPELAPTPEEEITPVDVCASADTVGTWTIPPPGDVCFDGGLIIGGSRGE